MEALVIICICTMVSIGAGEDAIVWERELSCGLESGCSIDSIAVDQIGEEVVIVGSAGRKGEEERDHVLWRVNQDGNITQTKSIGSVSGRSAMIRRAGGGKILVKPDSGEVIRLEADDAAGLSFFVTNRSAETRTAGSNIRGAGAEGVLSHDMGLCEGDNVLVVGQDGQDGVVIKTGIDGKTRWERRFDRGKTEVLSSVACSPDGTGCYVAGLSAPTDGKMTLAGAATVCVLRYDSRGELKASDFFEGGVSPFPASLPKVVCLPSGIVIVVYDKSKNAISTQLHVKAYSRELTALWEKQIFQTPEDGPPGDFDICATRKDRFVIAGVINYWDLRVYEYRADGALLETIELDGAVGPGRVCVDYFSDRIVAGCAAGRKETEKKAKIKLLALRSFSEK